MFHKYMCLMLLCACFSATAMEQAEAESLLRVARTLAKSGKLDMSERVYLQVMSYSENETPTLLLELGHLYEKKDDKVSAQSLYLHAFHLLQDNPKRNEKEFQEASKLVYANEPAMLQYNNAMREYNNELEKISHKNPNDMLIMALDQRVDEFHLERRWKKVAIGNDMVGAWSIKHGTLVTSTMVINANGTAYATNATGGKSWQGKWEYDATNHRINIKLEGYIVGKENLVRRRVFELHDDIWSCTKQDQTSFKPGVITLEKHKD